jgi:nitric oxide dioxygenase
MNERTVKRVQDTFQMVVPKADELSLRFYRRLFELDPSTRELFPEDLDEQRLKLVQMLAFLVQGLTQAENLAVPLRNLGARHHAYEVKAHHYGTVGQAMLESLSAVLGSEFDEETRNAWTDVYGVIASTMQAAA